jgi:transposase
MQKQAYGFRDMDFFKLKIMALHQTKYALVGWTEKTWLIEFRY